MKKFIYLIIRVLCMAGALILYLMPSDNQIEIKQVGGQTPLDYNREEVSD
ncbi:hypothetical protein GCM10007216_19400 [Thalassobacillus devorans]|uniref:Uncharacterized protein n=1 Tax=Thalassobacillus devorans TaxID=279813 RepID=A0ABQ1P3P8_9BACI|nr:hypothetical protein [Thalassobacillus devorans]NIK28117.1 hypothetical protein [Thalassobacillus devorans]GGC88751.1 hypothetical protein GCM10007216_19400 [Thalassobacillus devorans]